MGSIAAAVSRHRRVFVLGLVMVLVLAAVPLTAYVIVPQFVRSTVQEAAPVATAPPATGATPTISPGSIAVTSAIVLSGRLVRINAVDFGSGAVAVIKAGNQRFLRFENVEIAGAPAQRVYLSDRSDGSPGSFTDLGPLKATNGSFNYEIPATVDLAHVRSVVSWCTQFKTTVTYAPLQPN
jgi:hypothetical protein